MKILLILLNAALAATLVWACVDYFSEDGETVAYTTRDRSGTRGETAPAAGHADTLPAPDSAAGIVAAGNVFALDRVPSLATSQGRDVQMELVGIYTIGDCQGAVILRRNAQAGNQTQWMMGPPGMPGGPGQGPGGGPWGRRQSAQAESSTVVQQFYRVGETLDNGYRLVSVNGTSVTLSRNGGELTLQLAEASKNLGSATTDQGERRRNRGEEFGQMMMQQQMMMMQMMRDNNRRGRQNQGQDQNQPRGGRQSGGGMGGGPPGGGR